MPLAPITVRFGPTYERDIKRASLGPKTTAELQEAWDGIVAAFETNSNHPSEMTAGTAIPKNNREIYKIRVADPDHNAGKSGSYRLIYWWRAETRELIGLYFFHKSEKDDVTQKEINAARQRFVARSI